MIDLPPNAALDIRTRVGAGDARVLDQPDSNGWRVDQRFHVAGSGPHFIIDARVGFGQILVREGSRHEPHRTDLVSLIAGLLLPRSA